MSLELIIPMLGLPLIMIAAFGLRGTTAIDVLHEEDNPQEPRP